MIAAILAAALLGAQAPAGANVPVATTTAPAVPTAASAETAATQDQDKIVCKRQENTGSRFATRICHTKGQWAQIQKDARDTLTDQQSQSYRNPTNGH